MSRWRAEAIRTKDRKWTGLEAIGSKRLYSLLPYASTSAVLWAPERLWLPVGWGDPEDPVELQETQPCGVFMNSSIGRGETSSNGDIAMSVSVMQSPSSNEWEEEGTDPSRILWDHVHLPHRALQIVEEIRTPKTAKFLLLSQNGCTNRS